jgi:hypothetical protein
MAVFKWYLKDLMEIFFRSYSFAFSSPWRDILVEKLSLKKLVKKFYLFLVTWYFAIVFSRGHQWTPILSLINSVHNLTPYFHKIPVNVIFPSMFTSLKRFSSFMLYKHNFVCISHISQAWDNMLIIPFLDLIILINVIKSTKLLISSACNLIYHVIIS